MFDLPVQDPKLFIQTLRQFHEAAAEERAEMANALSDSIIGKRVDLALVRQELFDAGEHELIDALDRFIDLIEPYIEEGGVDE